MVYTLDVMAPIFSFVVLVQLPKRGHDSRRLPFLCLPCSGRPYTFLVAKNVVYRATKQLKYSHGTQRVNKHMVRTNRTTRQGSGDPLQVSRTAQFWDCGWFRDIRWIVNWSVVFVETVFESSFGFTYVLFGAVVVLYHVGDVFEVAVDVDEGYIGLVSPVEWNVYEVCPSNMYLQVR